MRSCPLNRFGGTTALHSGFRPKVIGWDDKPLKADPMIRRLIALILCLLPVLAMPAAADERPRAGLMWNRSGLPATLPMLVKTLPGKDYVAYIVDPETDAPVMAGYIHGGRLFRLLVPPGTWMVRFAYGSDWQNEGQLFGSDTGWTQMDAPLAFGAGVARRHGHIITLIEQNGKMRVADARPQTHCQIAGLDSTRHGWQGANREIASLLAGNGMGDFWGELRYNELDLNLRQIVCG